MTQNEQDEIDRNNNFWLQIISKLNANTTLESLIPPILEDVCHQFNFDCGFMYQSINGNTFSLSFQHYVKHDLNLQALFDLQDNLTQDEQHELLNRRLINCTAESKIPLENSLASLFKAQLLIITTVIDRTGKLVALIGLMNNAKKTDLNHDDILLTNNILNEVTRRVHRIIYQDKLQATQQLLEDIIDNMGVDVYVNDFTTHEILFVNQSMAAPYGGIDKLLGDTCWKALYKNEGKSLPCDYCPQKKLLDENGNPTKIYTWDYQRPFDGSWFRVFSRALPWLEGHLAHLVTSVDITENKRNEELIRQMAEYDPLVKLPNRRKLLHDAERCISATSSYTETGAVALYLFFFDLDEFKKINDTYGHQMGDKLLILVSNILENSPLTSGKAYRLGGDEFVILCPNHRLQQIVDIIQLLTNTLIQKIHDVDPKIICSASIGIAKYPEDGLSVSDLLKNADTAMYHSKYIQKGCTHFFNRGNIVKAEEYLNSNS